MPTKTPTKLSFAWPKQRMWLTEFWSNLLTWKFQAKVKLYPNWDGESVAKQHQIFDFHKTKTAARENQCNAKNTTNREYSQLPHRIILKFHQMVFMRVQKAFNQNKEPLFKFYNNNKKVAIDRIIRKARKRIVIPHDFCMILLVELLSGTVLSFSCLFKNRP